MSAVIAPRRHTAVKAKAAPAQGKRPAPRSWLDQVPSAAAQRDLKEAAILECAATWFHQHGFHGASLSDIAGDLGITKAALYHYASSKADLLYRLHMRSLAAAREARDRAVAEGVDGMDRLYRLVYNFVLVMTQSVTRTFILLEPGTLDAAQSKQILARRRWLEHDLRQLIHSGIEDGSIVRCDPKLATFIVVGAQNWIGSWYRGDGPWSGEQIAAGYASMMCRMLATHQRIEVPADLATFAPVAGAAPRVRKLAAPRRAAKR